MEIVAKRKPKPTEDEVERARQLLESKNFVVKPKRNYKKKTFDIDLDLLKEATDLRNTLEPRPSQREMFVEALELWIATRRGGAQ